MSPARPTKGEPREAGRALDAEIAEKVMGESCGFTFACPSCGGLHFGSSGPEHSNIECHDELGGGCRWTGTRNTVCFPHEHYSTDIAAAWLVVEKLNADGWRVEIDMEPAAGPAECACVVVSRDADKGEFHNACTPSFPLSLCLAALEAVQP